MSFEIRIALIICSLGTFAFVLHSIRKKKLRIEDSVFWFFLALIILILAFFPGIAYGFAGLFKFQAPISFVLLAFIVILLLKCFTLSIRVSQLETKLEELVQRIAVRQKNNEPGDDGEGRIAGDSDEARA